MSGGPVRAGPDALVCAHHSDQHQRQVRWLPRGVAEVGEEDQTWSGVEDWIMDGLADQYDL